MKGQLSLPVWFSAERKMQESPEKISKLLFPFHPSCFQITLLFYCTSNKKKLVLKATNQKTAFQRSFLIFFSFFSDKMSFGTKVFASVRHCQQHGSSKESNIWRARYVKKKRQKGLHKQLPSEVINAFSLLSLLLLLAKPIPMLSLP